MWEALSIWGHGTSSSFGQLAIQLGGLLAITGNKWLGDLKGDSIHKTKTYCI